jgi:hypothetical protein
MEDSPTNNFATLNPLVKTAGTVVFSEGNLEADFDGSQSAAVSTINVSSGKWYVEYRVGDGSNDYVGIIPDNAEKVFTNAADPQTGDSLLYAADGRERIDGTFSSYGTSMSAGDIVGIALNMTDSEITFYLNDVSQGAIAFSGSVSTASSVLPCTMMAEGVPIFNFGQDSSFAGNETAQGNQDGNSIGDFYYEPPSGYLALCTSNLSAPEIADPTAHFNTVLYTGNSGVAQSITGVGFEPDAVWIKRRNYAGGNNVLFDQVRGANISQHVNSALADITRTDALDSFDSDGFTLGADTGTNVNYGAYTYVSWNWKVGGAPTVDNSAGAGATPTAGSVKIDGANLGSALAGSIAATRLSANTTNGMSIVGYVGNATAGATIAHGLSQAPDLIAVKDRTSAYSWKVGSSSMAATSPWNYWMQFDDSEPAVDGSADIWNDSAPSASVFTIGDHVTINTDTDNFIAYCFHSVEGYSKIGSYIPADVTSYPGPGSFVYCGFRPKYLMTKNITGSTGNWYIFDTLRDPYNLSTQELSANTTGAEGTDGGFDILSNGFRDYGEWGYNYEGDTILYMAFAETPFKYSNAR